MLMVKRPGSWDDTNTIYSCNSINSIPVYPKDLTPGELVASPSEYCWLRSEKEIQCSLFSNCYYVTGWLNCYMTIWSFYNNHGIPELCIGV